MKVANLGDSGFLVLRHTNSDFKIVYKSEEQQHSFNAPYQLTRMPRGFAKKHRIAGYYHDHPDDAEVYSCQIIKGDIVILATDGLFDNLYLNDIVNLTKKHYKNCQSSNPIESLLRLTQKDTDKLARVLTTAAWKNSLSSKYISPFGEKVNSALKNQSCKLVPEFNEWRGGKKDDVSAVVGVVF
mmetsp:Transcript_22365/g.24886  ORF Transcript_22365/g.24886 Transcript_22365/m.24886 type:complete len:184 (+) Transcript_22365:100-651(+)